jgi:hypothetical protein
LATGASFRVAAEPVRGITALTTDGVAAALQVATDASATRLIRAFRLALPPLAHLADAAFPTWRTGRAAQTLSIRAEFVRLAAAATVTTVERIAEECLWWLTIARTGFQPFLAAATVLLAHAGAALVVIDTVDAVLAAG